jgi:hypothetical protein
LEILADFLVGFQIQFFKGHLSGKFTPDDEDIVLHVILLQQRHWDIHDKRPIPVNIRVQDGRCSQDDAQIFFH